MNIIGAFAFCAIEDQYANFFSLQHNACCTSSEEGQRTVSNYAQKVLEDLAGVGSERVSDSVGEEPSSLEVTPNRGLVRESPSQILTIQV